MEQLYLKDVCSFANGKAHEQYVDENGDYVLVTSKFIASDGEFYRRTNDRLTPLEIGDLCMVMSDVPKGRALAKCFLVDKNNTYTLNQRIGVFKADERYLKKYFYYLINRNKYFLSFDDGDSQTNLRKDDILNCPVICPDKAEQQLVVDILDGISEIIQNRKAQLKKLDELVKARFVELFGDIKTNEHGWEKCMFKDVSTKITDGEHGTVSRVAEGKGYLYFMARNITKDGEIDLSETSFVPQEIHEKIYKRCNPEKDDLLLVCVGATIGKCALVPEPLGEFSMARSVALIKPNKELVTSNFLINILRSEAIQNDIDHCSHAAAQAGLYTNMINSLEAFVPPMSLQIEFDEFCKQVDKSKVVA